MRAWLERGDIARDPAVTADTLREEVRAILAKPDAEVTPDDLRRLSLIEGVAGDKAQHFPSPRSYSFTTIHENGYSSIQSYVTNELKQLRTWLDRGDIARDPSITREQLVDEVRSILAKPDAEIGPEDMRRLATFEGIEGDKSLRFPNPRSYTFTTISDNGYSATQSYVAPELRQLRTWLDRADIEADPTATVETLRDEVASIALKSADELTGEDIRRLEVLAGLEGSRSLALPAPASYSYEQLQASFTPPSAHQYLEPIRTWAVLNSDAGFRELAAQLRAGKAVDLATLAAVSGRSAELAELGVSRTSMFDSAVAAMRAKAGANAQTPELEFTRQLVLGTEVPPELATLKQQTLDMAQANLDRMAGRLHDGYSNYSDLGEMGRIIENVELIGRVTAARDAARSTSAAAGSAVADATAGAARAGEQLSW
jgi:hypothetical protein